MVGQQHRSSRNEQPADEPRWRPDVTIWLIVVAIAGAWLVNLFFN